MGQDVHITRATDWRETDGHEISAAEWISLTRRDPSLAPDPQNGPNAVLWTAHPEGREDAWLDWFDGNIFTTEPDLPLLSKMKEIADQLGARVVGDANEELG